MVGFCSKEGVRQADDELLAGHDICALLTAREYGIAAQGLTAGTFLFRNLLPVTLGNILGGAGIVGCGYWLVYLRHTPYYSMPIEQEQKEIDIAEEY